MSDRLVPTLYTIGLALLFWINPILLALYVVVGFITFVVMIATIDADMPYNLWLWFWSMLYALIFWPVVVRDIWFWHKEKSK